MLLIGEDPRKHISDYSSQFQRDFLQLLRTSHGEKKVHMNHFYQEYIANKEHVHMNATRWPSLTEFAKHLGREGLCRVEDTEKGLQVSWIDNSPEALRRQDAIRKKERMDKGDEEREQKLIREQIERAKEDAEEMGRVENREENVLQREDGEKIKLNFTAKAKKEQRASPPLLKKEDNVDATDTKDVVSDSLPIATLPILQEKVSLKIGATTKPRNVFAATSKKNALGGAKLSSKEPPKKPMSEAERIMKEEIERKRIREAHGFAGLSTKRQKIS